MTPAELQHEWNITYQTRLGCLVGAEPNPPQWARDMAEREADEWVRRVRDE